MEETFQMERQKSFCSCAKIWQSTIIIPWDASSLDVCVGPLLQHSNCSLLHHPPKCCCHIGALCIRKTFLLHLNMNVVLNIVFIACSCGNWTDWKFIISVGKKQKTLKSRREVKVNLHEFYFWLFNKKICQKKKVMWNILGVPGGPDFLPNTFINYIS